MDTALKLAALKLALDLSEKRVELGKAHGEAFIDTELDHAMSECVVSIAESAGFNILDDNMREYEKCTAEDVPHVDVDYFLARIDALERAIEQ